MAKEDELELDVKAVKPAGKGKVIMLFAAIMLLTTGSVIGVLYFTGMLGSSSDDSANVQEKHDTGKDKKELVIKPAFYLNLQPAFVVNFEDQTHATYLQVEMQVMARSKDLLDLVTVHMPLIRNNILLILSAQKFEQVKTRAGKAQLQKTVLEAIQKVVSDAMSAQHPASKDKDKDKDKKKDTNVKVANVEQVYFTSFIMQ